MLRSDRSPLVALVFVLASLIVARTGLTSNALTTSNSTLNTTNEIASGTQQVTPPDPGPSNFEFVYDNAGNVIRQQVGATGTTRSSRVFTYDAWNRLTRLEFQKGTLSAWDGLRDPRAAYTYYAGHQLATRVADTVHGATPQATQRTHFYFDAEWRLLEERIDPGYALGPSSPWDWSGTNFETAFNPARQTGRQYIWDPSGGPNELVQVRTAPTAGTLSFAGSLWAATDRNSSVIAWVGRASDTGAYDRVHYRALGTPILMPPGDCNGDGVVDFSDYLSGPAAHNGQTIAPDGSAVAGFSRIDVNQDGTINFSDVLAVFANLGEAQEIGRIGGLTAAAGTNSGPVIGYAGAIWDPDASLCLMRYRWYDPGLGRFLSRDPAGYTDGSSLYLYALGNPLAYYDPWGLQRAPGCEDLEQDVKRGIGNRPPNTDLLTDEQKKNVKDASEEQINEWKDTGKELLKDTGKMAANVAASFGPGDEAMLGWIAANYGLKAARAIIGKIASVAGKSKAPSVTQLLSKEAQLLEAERKAAGAAGKQPRNPYGSKGKPDHQEAVDRLGDKARSEAGPRETVLREKQVQGHDGVTRRPDVQIVDKDKRTRKAYEAERKPDSKRNKEREADYDEHGIEYETHPVEPKPGG